MRLLLLILVTLLSASAGPADMQWTEDAAPRYNHVDLEARAQRLKRVEALREDGAWRIADGLGRWTCPFCAEPTMLQCSVDQ